MELVGHYSVKRGEDHKAVRQYTEWKNLPLKKQKI